MKRPGSQPRRGAAALEFALVLLVFIPLFAGVIDLAWLAFQRSALTSSVAIGCRVGALIDPGVGDAGWTQLEEDAEAAILAAMASTGAPCEDDCDVDVYSFGSEPGRSLGCTATRDFQPLTNLIMDPIRIESGIVVHMEWQR